MQAANQHQEPAQRSQGEYVHDTGALELCIWYVVCQRQCEEQSAKRRAHGIGKLEDGAAPGYGVDEMLLRHEVGKESGTGRAGEGAAAAGEKQYGIDGQDGMIAGSRESQ